MLYKLTTLLLVVLCVGFLQAQNRLSHETQQDVALTGLEGDGIGDPGSGPAVSPLGTRLFNSRSLVWTMTAVSGVGNGYDLQSNASTQQLWCDINNNPDFMHVVYMFSEQTAGYTDRTSMYYISTDGGSSWFQLGGVPVNTGTSGRSGYGVISGLSTGEAVIMNHCDVGTPARPVPKLWIDNTPFEYNFQVHEPGLLTNGDVNPYVIWPRMVIDGDDNIIFAGAQSANYGAADSFYTNRYDFATTLFDGFTPWDGNQAETYPFAISESGKIGLAFIGQTTPTTPPTYENDGDVFYSESTDGGLTWSVPDEIYTRDHSNDTTWGAMRGISLNFYGEEPCIVFETAWQDFAAGSYRQGDANSLYFWSPNVNGGVAKVLYDSSWVNWNPGGGANDVYMGVGRPVLSRSQSGNYLALAFSAATENTYPLNNESPFFDGYFMVSTDGGDTWTDAEKFTPDGPPLTDWRHISMPQILPVNPLDEDAMMVHITVQGDTIAGTQVQGTGIDGKTAFLYHFTTTIPIVGVDDDIVANNFNLEQNYPNPFNPSTSINYTLAERSSVSLKVYDVLGNEVANLVNTTQEAGKHSINFNAGGLASGLYIYTLNTGNFTSSKKMMLLK